MTCGYCGGKLKHYDTVFRIVRKKYGKIDRIQIERLRCERCRKLYRILPDDILPFKHYEKRIIKGVLSGTITPDDLEYEDYPSEMTMKRWKKDKYLCKIFILK